MNDHWKAVLVLVSLMSGFVSEPYDQNELKTHVNSVSMDVLHPLCTEKGIFKTPSLALRRPL